MIGLLFVFSMAPWGGFLLLYPVAVVSKERRVRREFRGLSTEQKQSFARARNGARFV